MIETGIAFCAGVAVTCCLWSLVARRERQPARDPIADAMRDKWKHEADILREVRRVCGVKE